MIKNKNQIIMNFIVLGIFLVFLDSYQLINIPISWIGQGLLMFIALIGFKKFKYLLTGKVLKYLAILLVVPQIYFIFNSIESGENLLYTVLRYFNIASFIVVLAFAINYSYEDKVNSEILLKKLRWFCIFYSVVIIYIFGAQIFDLFEPLRNRANTNLFRGSSQSIFWLSQPHRAMGTFREPSFLVTFFYPLVLLIIKSLKKTNVFFSILTGVALGLTRSDYARFFTIIVLIFFLYSLYVDKKINFNFILLILSILFFSSFGVLECNLNPDSIECSEYKNDVENINRSGKLKIKSNTASSVVEIGTERLSVINYFYESLGSLKPNGLSNVNQNFQTFESNDIANEMYLTNRTVPEYLLNRYSTKNFGTGNYSVLKYEINVQNIIVFYTQGFGVVFVAMLFILLIDFVTNHKLSKDLTYFIIILLFFTISPIEELNAYYGLIIGLSYGLLIKGKYYDEV
ncbi:hypothetical protein N9H62_01430 [Acidimicrobiia bacterium]|nr:hypothetical protein [Acidimicrobiia bacterium]